MAMRAQGPFAITRLRFLRQFDPQANRKPPRDAMYAISERAPEQNQNRCEKKKGPLAMASGPSLGRKRPRRAAIARGATAPQQYATALHKTQVPLIHFRCKIHKLCVTVTNLPFIYFL